MDFNFLETYKDYSTADLLKIVQRPADYQPAAVEAAKQLLADREVSEDDKQQVNEFFQEQGRKKRKKEIHDDNGQTGELFEPFTNAEKTMPDKWLHYLLAAITLQYIWTLYNTIKLLVYFFDCRDCPFDLYTAIIFLSLVYTPVIFFLLYKKRKWGWIILFAINLFGVISLFVPFVYFIYRPAAVPGGLISIVAPEIIKTAFVIFLWQKPVAGYFSVSTEIKRRTALLTAIAGAALLLYVYVGGYIKDYF